MLNILKNRENLISETSCGLLFSSCDWTESENVNLKRFSKIKDVLCDDNKGIVYQILL